MRLLDIELRTNNDRVRLIGYVERATEHRTVPWAINESIFEKCGRAGEPVEVFFEFPKRYEEFVSRAANAFAIALMLPSMASGESLEIDSPVSELLTFNLKGIRDIFHTWFPQFERIEIHAKKSAQVRKKTQPHAAAFFSGGVDSLYTLLKRLTSEPLPVPLTHIIFMHGVEQSLEESMQTNLSQIRAEKVAAMTGVDCIVGTTNLRTVFPLHWERYYVGTALAATALSLSDGLGYVCIPSSHSHRHQIMSGTSPLVDERFSTETIRVVHDGSEAGRAEKTARILEWNQDLVLQNLRVCIENAGGDFNCCECYKCVRTAVAIRAFGLWDKATTFPNKSFSHWKKIISDDHLFHTMDNLEYARNFSKDRDLVKLLDGIVRRRNRYDAMATYAKNSPLAYSLPVFWKLRELLGGSPRIR